MARSRPRIRWLELLDGPMAGERFSASIVPAGSRRVHVSRRAPGQPGMTERHEYELTGPLEARWVRHIETATLDR